MKAGWKWAGRILTVVAAATVLLAAVYIMARGLGLSEELDFGAGAYYYADIPDFEKYTEAPTYRTNVPWIVHVLLFLAWGWLMYRLWVWVDKRKK